MELTHNMELTISKLYEVLRSLRLSNGLYKASHSKDYNFIWWRDVFYEVLPELKANPKLYMQTYHKWLDYYNNIERQYGKFTHIINKGRLDYDWAFPHARVDLNAKEIHNQSWGHMQVDTLGYFLFGVVLGHKNDIPILRNNQDKHTVDLVIRFLESINYWALEDSGIWEEYKENRSSSCGAAISGLIAIKDIGFNVDNSKLTKAINHFSFNLLPNETKTREMDMSLLTLIYPFNILPKQRSISIIEKIEKELVREKGTIRYHGDQYYNFGAEAQWTIGNLFLGIIYADNGNLDKAKYYYDSVMQHCSDGNIPELYHSNGDKGNNTPLGWSVALAIILAEKIKNK